MNQDRKKKIYVAIIVLALVALAMDKLMFGDGVTNPDTTYASIAIGANNADTSVSTATGISAIKGVKAIPELPFPRTLVPFNTVKDRRDLFALPESVEQLLNPNSAQTRAKEREQQPTLHGAERFKAAQHKITAIMTFGDRTVAIIDQQKMVAGDELNDCTLTDIDALNSIVTFECSDGQVGLKIHPINTAQGP